MKPKSDKPLISIILPIAHNEKLNLINSCLKSISQQKSNNFELIIVHSKNRYIKQALSRINFTQTKTFENNLGKSAARNFGVKQSFGAYLFNMDVDMELPTGFMESVSRKALDNNSEAIIASADQAKDSNFWAKCRELERDLILGDPYLEIPLFIKRSLFLSVGGYNEELDALDDWELSLKLRAKNTKFDRIASRIVMHEPRNLRELLKRKFQRGQSLQQLIQKYGNLEEVNFSRKLSIVIRSLGKLSKNPVLFSGFIFLKSTETAAFWLGTLQPKEANP